MDGWGFLQGQQYLIFDRDTKFYPQLRDQTYTATTDVT
jgi:hypothetical protein